MVEGGGTNADAIPNPATVATVVTANALRNSRAGRFPLLISFIVLPLIVRPASQSSEQTAVNAGAQTSGQNQM
jgi:hypothetical protein